MDINHIRATVQLIVGIALFKVASQVALWHTAPLFSQLFFNCDCWKYLFKCTRKQPL